MSDTGNVTLKKICEALGISYVWWHWRWMNFKSRMATRFSRDHNVVRRLKTPQKICRCGAIAAPDQRKCIKCGRGLPTQLGWFLYKVFGLVAPGFGVATAVIGLIIFVDAVIVVMRGGAGAILYPHHSILIEMGALSSLHVAMGEWWRLFTCVFLHIGFMHLAFNMLALVNVSQMLEEEIGPARYSAVFLLTGLGGSLASLYLRSGPVISAGASGALFGLIGFSIGYFRRIGSPRSRDITSFMVRWAIYGFLFGLMLRADNLAHGGGFLTGLALGSIMEYRESDRSRYGALWSAVCAAMALVYAAAFVMLAM